jgi:hypothetical protein
MKGDLLELLDGHKYPVLALSRITPTGLENRAWSIDQYFDGAMLVTAPPVTQITFMNGGVDGGTGCCGLSGTYSLSGAHLQLPLACFYGGWCPAEYESHTDPILKALHGGRIVEPDGQRIILQMIAEPFKWYCARSTGEPARTASPSKDKSHVRLGPIRDIHQGQKPALVTLTLLVWLGHALDQDACRALPSYVTRDSAIVYRTSAERLVRFMPNAA